MSMVASVDLDDLPAKQAKKVRSALAGLDFEGLATQGQAASMPGAADTFQYDLEVTGGRRRSLTVHEPVADPRLRTLLDVLLPLAEPE